MKKISVWFASKSGIIYKVLLFISVIALIVALFPKEYKFKYNFQQDKPWIYEDLIAPFDFAISKSKSQIDQERQDIIRNSKPYFKMTENTGQKYHDQLAADIEAKWSSKYGTTDNAKSLKQATLSFCQNLLDTIYASGIIEVNKSIENKEKDFTIFVLRKNVAEERSLGSFFTISSSVRYIRKSIDAHRGIDRDIAAALLNISLEQNIVFDAEKTDREKIFQLNNISLTHGIEQKGQLVISKGEIVVEDKYLVLTSLKSEYEGQSGNSYAFLLILIGQTMLISIAIIVLVLFLIMFRRDIYADNRKLILILSLIMIMVITTSILLKRFNAEYVSLVPLCLVPFIVRAFFDTRLGLFVHIITTVIIGFLVPNGFEFVFLQLIAGIVTIISVVNLEKRSQFFLTSIYIFIAYSATYTGMNLAQDGNLNGISGYNLALFAGSSALTLLSFPLIFLYERVFGFVTSLSLLELSNTNSKLLRELSLKAAGTFQHSLQVANLSEEAVFRIGGNSILARTGALYHDIGKLNNPVYFSENQIGGVNPHEKLSYMESAHILTSHVPNGIELAHKYKLPEQIIDFIRTHHGTRKAGYFYALYKTDHPDTSSQEEAAFTYSGPLPFSKETAVVMMADATEAASKSLKMPDKQSISDLVEGIIDKQLEQKQFKNCDITHKDITRVKHVFKQRLMNIYHVRIEYPA